MFFLSSVFGSIAVPVFTEKALVPNQKILDRREELYKKYHDKLDDPTVMSMIEQELITMDKEYLKDDSVNAILEQPNNILGIEYIKALYTLSLIHI